MNPGDPRPLLDRHAARVLTRWRERLRALPPSSALAHPDLLGPLMAPALARVRQEAVQPNTDSPAPASAAPEEPVSCRCGLNPLVAFYLTGECATFDVLWGQADALPHLAPGEREQLCRTLSQAWRRVATDEISLFCSLCQRRTALEAQDKARAAHAAHAHPKAPASTPAQTVGSGAAPAPGGEIPPAGGGDQPCRGAEAALSAAAAAACSGSRDKPSGSGRRSGETRG